MSDGGPAPSRHLLKYKDDIDQTRDKKNTKTLKLPLELCSSGLSGLGAKSDPIPEEPRDRVEFRAPSCCLVTLSPTIRLFRQRRSSVAAKLPLDRCTVS